MRAKRKFTQTNKVLSSLYGSAKMKMPNHFIACALMVLSCLISQAHAEKCEDAFNESANSDIIRFGGLRPRTPVQEIANLMLAHVPSGTDQQIQIAIPVFLETNPQQAQQFGDGQENANTSFGPLQNAPFVAVLTRPSAFTPSADLAIFWSKGLTSFDTLNAIEVRVGERSQRVAINSQGSFRLPVDLPSLAWDQAVHVKPIFFRPVGWTDWFAVQFPNPYLPISDLLKGMGDSTRTLSSGHSVIDPLGLKGSANMQSDLRQIDDNKNLGFILARTERSQRVHGIYLDKNNQSHITATGGVWVRYRAELPFKNVYLTQDPRVIDLEEEEGGVSGTGPHYVGANGEIIVNSLMNENVMTLQGTALPPAGPSGEKLAWGFTHQWVGTRLRPGYAFITTQGNFHWHLNHLLRGNGVQVFTPPEVPGPANFFGFPKS